MNNCWLKLTDKRTLICPKHVFSIIVIYLGVAWLLVYLIDVFNVFGLREAMHGIGLETPGVWYSVFQETGPTEWLQWLALGAGSIVTAFIVGQLTARASIEPNHRVHVMFWSIMTIALTLMLIEDAGDPRDKIAQYVTALAGDPIAGNISEFIYYVLIASIPLYALFRYGLSIWPHRLTRRFVLLGFAFYAFAGGTSSIRYVGDWYERAGGLINDYIMLGRLERADMHNSHEFWLMDCIIEESVELLGATAFLAAALAFVQEGPLPRTVRTDR